jgi:hypothetical protein
MPGKAATGFPSGIATKKGAMPGKVGTGFPSGIATKKPPQHYSFEV